MNKYEKRRKYCSGCEDNFYNGNNPHDIQECWNLRDAEVVWRKKIHVDQRPPWPQKPVRVLDCYRQKGYVFWRKDA